jgi:hypothetical protein
VDRLHPMTKASVILLLAFGAKMVSAGEYCSLVVRVLSPDGRRVEALVSVEEGNGRVIERDPTSEDVKFCDLGIAPVTVKVGADGTCNQVVVRDVPLTWQEQHLLTVTYDLEPCLEDLPPPPVPVCQVLFRVSDVNGRWLNKASIHFQQPRLSPRETDREGRALLVLKLGDRVTGSISSGGYVAKPFSLSCSRSKPVREEPIKLERPPGQ